jgi:hypothetical protein
MGGAIVARSGGRFKRGGPGIALEDREPYDIDAQVLRRQSVEDLFLYRGDPAETVASGRREQEEEARVADISIELAPERLGVRR